MKNFKPVLITKWICLLFCLNLSINAAALNSLNTQNRLEVDRAFIGANILNPNLDFPISNATVLVSQGRIVKIQSSNEQVPANYALIDVKNKWLIPGLIDGHIHLAQSGGAFTRPDILDATKISSYETDQKWLHEHSASILKRYLALGITTVFDMGGPSEYLENYQRIINKGTYPDVYAAGALISPMAIPKLNVNGETFSKVTNADEARSAVSNQIALKSHIIKIVWSQENGLTTKQLFEMYTPAIALAKKHNKVIAIHVEGLENAKMAIKAGADILVHGVTTDRIDSEFIGLMEKNNVTYMPTLTVYEHYFQLFKNELTFTPFEHQHSHDEIINSFKSLIENVNQTDQMFQIFLKYMPRVDDSDAQLASLSQQEQSIVKQLRTLFSSKVMNIHKKNLKDMINADVNVAFGTDAGNPGTLHASSVYGEILAWQQAGISNKDILKAATFGNAKALNLQHDVGTITHGKYADFVVLNNNPYETLNTLVEPVMTVKRGVVINGSGAQVGVRSARFSASTELNETSLALSDSLKQKRWNHGSANCENSDEPDIEVHQYNQSSYILRQNKCTTYEAPFIYVLIGDEKVLVVDTGAIESSALSPLYETVRSLLDNPSSQSINADKEILVIHSHGHRDHYSGDIQFQGKPNVTVVEPSRDSVDKFFGFNHPLKTRAYIDLGQRKITVISTPGHQEEAITIYDPKNKWLLTGDTFYPGAIFVKDWKDYKNSIARLVSFIQTNEVSFILGTHIEMTNTAGKYYSIGTTYQPEETSLVLVPKDLLTLNDVLKKSSGERTIVLDRLVVEPMGLLQKTISNIARWLTQ
ncbi:amidohydrolase family protein [Psychrosphaera sp.]|nr:amidohydrolase family protein [Psychrosphaera sp.]